MAERIMIPAKFAMWARRRGRGGTPESRPFCRPCAVPDLVSRNPLIQFNAMLLPWKSRVGQFRNCLRQILARCALDVEAGDVG